MAVQAKITSVGSYLPSKILTNKDLELNMDTSDEWINTRTGIKKRHIADNNELTSDLATEACKAALKKVALKATDIDLIIVATTTPDHTFPSTATIVQSNLGANNAFAFDVQAVCSGFLYALSIADKYIKSGECKHALVIGAETLSRILDWKDRTTCVLFGDGAGAVVLSATDEANTGIIDINLYSDGDGFKHLYTDGGTAYNGEAGVIKMEGQDVFKNAVSKMSSSITTLLDKHNIAFDDIGLVVPHQANMRIMDSIAKKLHLNITKVIRTVDMHANTSAASIPLALDVAINDGRLQKGQNLVFTALGAGFTWGAGLVRW